MRLLALPGTCGPGPALEPYVQDALDEIEYVTGSKDTKWGASAAETGTRLRSHCITSSRQRRRVRRLGLLRRTLLAVLQGHQGRYADLQIIATAPIKSMKPDVLDEHFYMSAEKSFSMANYYDTRDRNGPKIFVGEWATREGDPTPNLQAALGDAAWLTGLERNSDLIIMESYAPLFVNVNAGGMQWAPD